VKFLVSHMDEKPGRFPVEDEKPGRSTHMRTSASIGKDVGGGNKEGPRGPKYPQTDCAKSRVNPHPNARRSLSQMEWLMQLASSRSHSRPASRDAYNPPKSNRKNQDVSESEEVRRTGKTSGLRFSSKTPAQLEWHGCRRSGVHRAIYGMGKVTMTQRHVRCENKQCVDNTGSSSRIARLRWV
jgi:hypothetical protein